MRSLRYTALALTLGFSVPSPASSLSLTRNDTDPMTPALVARLELQRLIIEEFRDAGPRVRSIVDREAVFVGVESLKVCFLPEEPQLRAPFVQAARRWIPTLPHLLDFGSEPSFRSCAGGRQEDIRVAFRADKRGDRFVEHWSFLGNESRRRDERGASLNINPGITRGDMAAFRIAVMHELGHALGLEHEHRHPDVRCIDRIDKPIAQAIYKLPTLADVEAMFAVLVGKSGRYDYGRYNKLSIMHYALREELFKDGDRDLCHVGQNQSIHNLDLAAVIAQYSGGRTHSLVQLQVRANETSVLLANANFSETQLRSFGRLIAERLGTMRGAKTEVRFDFTRADGAPKSPGLRKNLSPVGCDPDTPASGVQTRCELDAGAAKLRIFIGQ